MATPVTSPAPTRHILLTGSPGIGKTTLVCKVCEVVRKRCGLTSVVQGFYTEEVRESVGGRGRGRGKRIGFDIVTFDGKRGPLARIDSVESAVPPSSQRCPYVGKYRVNLQSFESLALPALQTSPASFLPAASPAASIPAGAVGGGGACDDITRKGRSSMKRQLMVIDEVGKMELFSHGFVERVKTLFDTASMDTSTASKEAWQGGVVLLATIPVQRGQQKQHWLLESIRHRKDCLLFEVNERNRDQLVDEIAALILQRLD